MKNPYEAELPTDRILPGRKLLVIFLVVFCAFLILPITFRLFIGEEIATAADGTLRGRSGGVVEGSRPAAGVTQIARQGAGGRGGARRPLEERRGGRRQVAVSVTSRRRDCASVATVTNVSG